MASRHPINFAEAKNDSTIWGRFVESIVGTHLINSITGEDVNLGYWREGQAEIDFVLYNDFTAVAFEVKSVHRTMQEDQVLSANDILNVPYIPYPYRTHPIAQLSLLKNS